LKTIENKLHDLLRTQPFQPMLSKLDVLVQHTAKGFHPKQQSSNVSLKYFIHVVNYLIGVTFKQNFKKYNLS